MKSVSLLCLVLFVANNVSLAAEHPFALWRKPKREFQIVVGALEKELRGAEWEKMGLGVVGSSQDARSAFVGVLPAEFSLERIVQRLNTRKKFRVLVRHTARASSRQEYKLPVVRYTDGRERLNVEVVTRMSKSGNAEVSINNRYLLPNGSAWPLTYCSTFTTLELPFGQVLVLREMVREAFYEEFGYPPVLGKPDAQLVVLVSQVK